MSPASTIASVPARQHPSTPALLSPALPFAFKNILGLVGFELLGLPQSRYVKPLPESTLTLDHSLALVPVLFLALLGPHDSPP